MKKFKVGDTAYLVESSLYIRKGTIKNCYGNMYLFKYADGAGIKVGSHRLFRDEEAAKAEVEKFRPKKSRSYCIWEH